MDDEVGEIIDDVERRAAKKLEASNAAVGGHIDSLLERLAKLEKTFNDPVGDDEQKANPSWQPVKRGASEDTEEEGGSVSKASGGPPSKASGQDPDRQQEGYAEFLAVTGQNLGCVGVHAWSLGAASRRQTGCGCACLALVPSFLVLIVQFVLLHAISLESLSPTCVGNSDCRAGTWCSPSNSPAGYGSTPGTCDDCAWAGVLQASSWEDVQTANLPGRYDQEAYEAAKDTVAAAVAHCTATDANADRCDFLVDFHRRMTLGPFLVLLCATTLLLMSFVADMDKQVQAASMFAFRTESVATYSGRTAIAMVVWVIFQLRRFALPGMAAYAYAAIVLAGPPTPGMPLPVAFVLAGVAVGAIYNMDGLLAMALLGDGAKALVRQAFASEDADAGEKEFAHAIDPWFHFAFHRFAAVCLLALILAEVLATETLMEKNVIFRLDWGELPTFAATPNPKRACTNIATMLMIANAIAVVLFMQTWVIGIQMCRRLLRPVGVVFAPVVAALFMPLLAHGLGQVVHWPMA